MKTFHLDIITPSKVITYSNVSYLRVPALDGLLGIKAKHASSIIAIDIGEIKVKTENDMLYFSTSGGYTDIKSEGVQLLLETLESFDEIDKQRAQSSLDKAHNRMKDKSYDLERVSNSIRRAQNRLSLFNRK